MSLVQTAIRSVNMKSMMSLALAVAWLSYPVSNFAAMLPVPPTSGGEGIQLALDALPAGGEILLTAGQYLVRQPVILRKDHQTLRGCGASTVLFLADGANCPVVVLGSTSASAKAAVKNLRLADLFIDGNRKHQQNEVWRFLGARGGLYNNGVDVWNADGATVESVVCCRCRS